MKSISLIAAGGIIVIANALALVHSVRNRAGTPEAEVTLTQRELRYFHPAADDDSAVTLHLQWTEPDQIPWDGQNVEPPVWLDQQKLQRLGFDCSVNPSTPDAARHYQRQRSRQAFIALEYDGPAWRAWLESSQRAAAQPLADQSPERSHLVAVDVDIDALKLRARHPDRTAVIILPAVVGITFQSFSYRRGVPDAASPARVAGRIQQLPSSIYVPRPFSDRFRQPNLRPRVRLRYGASLEPWVAGVAFP